VHLEHVATAAELRRVIFVLRVHGIDVPAGFLVDRVRGAHESSPLAARGGRHVRGLQTRHQRGKRGTNVASTPRSSRAQLIGWGPPAAPAGARPARLSLIEAGTRQ